MASLSRRDFSQTCQPDGRLHFPGCLLALPLSMLVKTNAVWALIPLYLILKDRYFQRIPAQ